MGSGIFPLYRSDEFAKKILKMTKELDDFVVDIIHDIMDGTAGGSQFDNTTIDGMYIHRLRLASELLGECVREE